MVNTWHDNVLYVCIPTVVLGARSVLVLPWVSLYPWWILLGYNNSLSNLYRGIRVMKKAKKVKATSEFLTTKIISNFMDTGKDLKLTFDYVNRYPTEKEVQECLDHAVKLHNELQGGVV